MEAEIRAATPADQGEVERIVSDAYAKYVSRIGRPPGPMLDDYAARTAEGTVFVAADEHGIAGILVLIPEPDHLLLDNIAVVPARQGKGIGQRLLDFAEAEAARLGRSELRLYTHVLMHENLALYTRAGWEETGRGEQSGYQRVFMRKAVPGRPA